MSTCNLIHEADDDAVISLQNLQRLQHSRNNDAQTSAGDRHIPVLYCRLTATASAKSTTAAWVRQPAAAAAAAGGGGEQGEKDEGRWAAASASVLVGRTPPPPPPRSTCARSTLTFQAASHEKKGKGSPYLITERRVPELIPVLGSQPAGDVSHKPGGRLPLLSARPVVTLATLKTNRAASSFTAW